MHLSILWLLFFLKEAALMFLPQRQQTTTMRLIACTSINRTGLQPDRHSICVHYYSGIYVSWYSAHATCRSKGLTLSSIPTDLGIAIYTPEWIGKHRVWINEPEFLKRLQMKSASVQDGAVGKWMVNAHRYWYGKRGPALENGTLLQALEDQRFKTVNWSILSNCVYLEGFRFWYVDCNSNHRSNFACIQNSSSINLLSPRSECPSGWISAKINGRLIGKCYKVLQNPAVRWATWDRGRGACFDEGGDLLSLNNQLEHNWFSKYIRNFSKNGIRVFLNLHQFAYCNFPSIRSWCWASGNNFYSNDLIEFHRGFNIAKSCVLYEYILYDDIILRDNYNSIVCDGFSNKTQEIRLPIKVICELQLSNSSHHKILSHDVNSLDLHTNQPVYLSEHSSTCLNSSTDVRLYDSILFNGANRTFGTFSLIRNPLLIPLLVTLAVAVISFAFVLYECLCARNRTCVFTNSRSVSPPDETPGPIQLEVTHTSIQDPIIISEPQPLSMASIHEYGAYPPVPFPPNDSSCTFGTSYNEHEFEGDYDTSLYGTAGLAADAPSDEVEEDNVPAPKIASVKLPEAVEETIIVSKAHDCIVTSPREIIADQLQEVSDLNDNYECNFCKQFFIF